jgi:hypothetical protein
MKKKKKHIVKDLELELLAPETRKSTERLNELLSDDFFEFTQSGLAVTKKDIINTLPKSPEEKFIVSNYIERSLSESLMLVHYVANREILESGEKRCTLCSSIWQNKNNKWQMVFFQGTPSIN